MASPIQLTSRSIARFRLRRGTVAVGCLCLALFIADLARPALLQGLRGQLRQLSAPALTAVHFAGEQVARPVNALTGLRETFTKAGEQEATAQRLRELQVAVEHLQRENRELRANLDVVPPPQLERLTARTVPLADALSGRLRLVRFSGPPLATDMAALSHGQLVGRIVDVTGKTATLMLLTDARARVAVMGQRSGIEVILAGTGHPERLDIRYRNAPQGLQPGESLLTTGSGDLYPAGIPVATVQQDGNGTLSALPLAGMERIDWVQLVRYRDSVVLADSSRAKP